MSPPTRNPPLSIRTSTSSTRSSEDLPSATSTLLSSPPASPQSPSTYPPQRYSDNPQDQSDREGDFGKPYPSHRSRSNSSSSSIFARTSTWIFISSILLLILTFGSAGVAHPRLRQHLLPSTSQSVVVPPTVNSVEWSTSPPSLFSTSPGPPKLNATIVILVNPYTNFYKALLPTLTNIETRFNRRLGYPIQLLTDGRLPDQKIIDKTSWITGGKAKWSLVTPEQGWGPPDWITEEEIHKSEQEIGFSIGYRNMCRFFSMFHFKHPAVQPYEYVWRLDEGINFHCQLMEDPIELMQQGQSKYGFSQIEIEAPFVIPTLWNTTLEFLATDVSKGGAKGSNNWIKEGENWQELISEDQMKSYTRRMFYNNFEIVHRSFFESDAYQAYTTWLDRAGGFYKERWGDAPVRTISTSLFLRKSEFYNFSNLTGYQHDDPNFVCPDLDWCDCDPEKSGRNGGGNWKKNRREF